MAVSEIRKLIDETLFIDTHEHLVEESRRLQPSDGGWLLPCDDAAYLLNGYAASDLIAAGMSGKAHDRFLGREADLDEKWEMLAPYWPRIRHTGYGQAARVSLQTLYGEDDFTRESWPKINEAFQRLKRPGFYREVLREKAGIESCQVNSLDRIFQVTEQPDLLMQDISTLHFMVPDLDAVERETGRRPAVLQEWLEAVDWYFEEFGARAVAVKNQFAYQRRLDYEDVSQEEASPLFERLARGSELNGAERKAVQDFLFRYTVRKATEHDLPVKLHTGYYAGIGHMPLDRVGKNPGDMCRLAADFPDTRFVVMHIGYPYQEQMIALAKHFSNVHVDMCWAWIINPAASVRFVRDFLMAVPWNKLLTFGGDYIAVEQVVGHAAIARRGLAEAVESLVSEGWISEGEVLDLIPELMNGNARRIFRLEERFAEPVVEPVSV